MLILDHQEREALRRTLRVLKAAVIDHRQYNNGAHPESLKVSYSRYLLLRSADLVDDDSFCERFRTFIEASE